MKLAHPVILPGNRDHRGDDSFDDCGIDGAGFLLRSLLLRGRFLRGRCFLRRRCFLFGRFGGRVLLVIPVNEIGLFVAVIFAVAFVFNIAPIDRQVAREGDFFVLDPPLGGFGRLRFDINTGAPRQADFDEENGFLPLPPSAEGTAPSVIYLCSPNNPTGAVYSYEGLTAWVDFALATGSLIIFDAAYEAFITEDKPHTIYEIPGAENCAVEVSSFSKFAGFTGVRCGWTVVPDTLEVNGVKLSKFWARRQATKFNGVSYVTQKGAAASLSGKGLEDCKANIAYYKRNAAALAEVFTAKGIYFTGGVNSPYIWLKCPGNMGGWEFFDLILGRFGIVGTPGEGFGSNGSGFFRLTAFGSYENTIKACGYFREL